MKPLTKYQCEVCNHWFDNETEALECEESHLKINKTETIYLYSPKDPIPYAIVLSFSNFDSPSYDKKDKITYNRHFDDLRH